MKKNSQKLILVGALALLLSFLLVIFVVVPKISTVKSLSNQAAQKSQELTDGRNEVESIKNAVALINTAKSDVSMLGVAIPTKEKAEESLAQISAAASQAMVQLKNINVAGTEENNLKLSVSILGKYEDTLNFIKNLEVNLRPISISDLAISANSDGSLLTSTFNLSLPFLADNTPQGS